MIAWPLESSMISAGDRGRRPSALNPSTSTSRSIPYRSQVTPDLPLNTRTTSSVTVSLMLCALMAVTAKAPITASGAPTMTSPASTGKKNPATTATPRQPPSPATR